ncbi:unnamed protein product [Cladocopium goreaui]|uniref:Transposon protein n=1 Tax=Cladocopium goreaui TaxID=2562237 RepID=A0A9P1DX81_9DINO|nr:unnamed protein product [Cladocopium goreaui]
MSERGDRLHFSSRQKAVALPIRFEGYEHKAVSVEHSQWLDTEDLRRCLPILSGAPTPNLSPEALESWNRPVPQDDESDASSLAPLPSGQLDSERDPMHAFQTFGDTKNEITSGGEMPHDMDPNGTEVNENLEPLATGMGGKRAERMGNRRGQVDGKTSAGATSVQGEGEKRENYGHENGLEEALGDQVLQHFQQEAMRLQSQNSMLSKELQKLREEKQRNELNESVAALRLWKRKASRAAELRAQLPMIRTLDGISKPVAGGSAQASFRIATFRVKHNLNVQPSLENLWLFFDLLLAEAEDSVADGRIHGNLALKRLAGEEGKGKGDGSAAADGNGVGSGKKSETNGTAMAMGSSELLSEATKLLKSLHLPSVKKITLQELGDPLMSPSNLMLLGSGATHSLRRARIWDEWNQAHQTVVALAQGSTSNLRLKHGTNTLLSTPEDASFGNGILPMGALSKIGFEIAWGGGDCRVHGPAGEKINVQVVNGCPMIECQLENDSQLSAARAAIVRAIMQQPDLMKHFRSWDLFRPSLVAHHAGLYQLAAMRMMEDQNRLEARFIFALEQPQDPKEYRPQQDIDKSFAGKIVLLKNDFKSLPTMTTRGCLDEVVDEDGVDGNVEDGELPRFEADVEDRPCEEDEAATNRAKTAYDSWMKLVEEHEQVKVKTLTFAEVITSRATGHVLEGLAKIYAKIRSLALPVLRLHADRARELTSKAVQSWCHSRDIVATYTSGSDWKSNGRAENESGIVKRHAKIIMRAHNIDEERWPSLVKHAAERRLRWQLQQVGYPVPDLLPFYTKVLVKRKSWNQRYAAWMWERTPGRVCGPDPWSSLTSGGYCAQLEDGTFLASTDVVVEQSELGEGLTLDLVVQERLQVKCNSEGDHMGVKRLLEMHQETACLRNVFLWAIWILNKQLAFQHSQCWPIKSLIWNFSCKALGLEKKHKEEEKFLVTKTITTEQVYKEWEDWKIAMMSEYTSIVDEQKAVRQVTRAEAQRMAVESNIKYEELPSKVVFTGKMWGKRKVRACICGSYENEVATATYAGVCDASQIRCLIRHAALEKWALYGTDIKCAFLNAERKDRTELIAMFIPYIYVKLGVASHSDVWLADAAMYGLVASPRDWADHRDVTIPTMVWQREENGKKWKGLERHVQKGCRSAIAEVWECAEAESREGDFEQAGVFLWLREEAEFVKSENLDLVRRARACTGAIALACMIYADHPGPSHGARGQLSKPRCVRTIEAFSDISYASTKGYRRRTRELEDKTLSHSSSNFEICSASQRVGLAISWVVNWWRIFLSKIVSGPAFEKALQDLCIAAGEGKKTVGDIGQPSTPQLDMLHWSSSEEESERRVAENIERANYVPTADVDELRAMVSQSRRIQKDPHNKMHGRTPEMYENESSQLPGRRKKKVEKKRLDSDEEEAAAEKARHNDEFARKFVWKEGRFHGGGELFTNGLRCCVIISAELFTIGLWCCIIISARALHNRAVVLRHHLSKSSSQSGCGVASSSQQSSSQSGCGVASSSQQELFTIGLWCCVIISARALHNRAVVLRHHLSRALHNQAVVLRHHLSKSSSQSAVLFATSSARALHHRLCCCDFISARALHNRAVVFATSSQQELFTIGLCCCDFISARALHNRAVLLRLHLSKSSSQSGCAVATSSQQELFTIELRCCAIISARALHNRAVVLRLHLSKSSSQSGCGVACLHFIFTIGLCCCDFISARALHNRAVLLRLHLSKSSSQSAVVLRLISARALHNRAVVLRHHLSKSSSQSGCAVATSSQQELFTIGLCCCDFISARALHNRAEVLRHHLSKSSSQSGCGVATSSQQELFTIGLCCCDFISARALHNWAVLLRLHLSKSSSQSGCGVATSSQQELFTIGLCCCDFISARALHNRAVLLRLHLSKSSSQSG